MDLTGVDLTGVCRSRVEEGQFLTGVWRLDLVVDVWAAAVFKVDEATPTSRGLMSRRASRLLICRAAVRQLSVVSDADGCRLFVLCRSVQILLREYMSMYSS